MKRYILNITTLVVAIFFSANLAWGEEWTGQNSGNHTISSGKTVQITGTIEISTTLTITANGNCTIIPNTSIDGAMFHIKPGGQLTIKGSSGKVVTIDGGAVFSGGAPYNSSYEKTTNSGKTVYHAIHNEAGGLSLEYVTIQNVSGATDSGGNSTGSGGGILIDGEINNNNYNKITSLNHCKIKNCVAEQGSAIQMTNKINAKSTVSTTNVTAENCKVVIQNTTIENCYSQGDNKDGSGGTIRTNGNGVSNVYLKNVTIKNNYSNGNGGAIYWNAKGRNDTMIVFDGCTITNNTAKGKGGAMMLETSYDFVDTADTEKTYTEISYNKVLSEIGTGGGIVVTSYGGSAMSVASDKKYTFNFNLAENLKIDNNESAEGAGISFNLETYKLNSDWNNNDDSSQQITVNLNLNGATISNNKATNGNGGGIRFYNNTAGKNGKKTIIMHVKLNKGNVQGNTATGKGAGIYLYKADISNDGNNGTLNISSNLSDSDGAGIYVEGGKNISLGAVTLSSNKAKNGAGGAIYLNGNSTSVTTSKTTSITDNYCKTNGGAIYVSGGTVNLTTPTITGNGKFESTVTTANGGAVYVTGTNSGFTTTGTATIQNNTSTTKGGAIYVSGGSVNMAENTISGNSSKEGGAIYVNGGNLTTTGTTSVTNNYANEGNGGAFYVTGGNVKLNNATITGNGKQNSTVKTVSGGAVYVTGSGGGFELTGSNTALIQNNASTTNGGAIYVGSGSVTLQEATISGNTSGNGGAIYAKGNVTINDEATISTNTATYNGGAIYVEYGNLTTKKVTASGNSAANGGVFFVKGGNVNLGVTVSGNGGAIALENGVFTMHNDSKISSNSAGGYGGALYIKNEAATSITCKGGTFSQNTAKAGGAVCADGPITLALAANIEDNTAQVGGGIYLVNGVNMTFGDASQPLGLIRANKAEGTTTSGTAKGMNAETVSGNGETVSGVGGGIFMADGTTLKFANPKELGIYNNSASFAGADICANGNNTSITLPQTSEMNLTGFDVPGNMLYWAEDFANGDTGYPGDGRGIRYEDELRAQSPNVKHFSADSSHEVVNYVCLDLGYDLVFVKIKNIGLQLNDDCAVTISYDKVKTDANGEVIKDGNGNPTYVLTEYRKILFSGNNNNSVYDTEIGLPSNDSWKFKVTQWSYKYDGVVFSPGNQERQNASATVPDAIYGISKDGIKWNNGNSSDRLITIKHILKKDGNNDINISDFNTRVVNKMIPGGSSSSN